MNIIDEDVEGVYRHSYGDLHDVERWLIDRAGFSEEEVRGMERVEYGNNGLALMFKNGDKPYIVGMVRGMSLDQLRRFSNFRLSSEGNGQMIDLNRRWFQDEIDLGGLDDENGLLRYEKSRDFRLAAEARAYFVIANRGKEEIFKG